MSLKLECLEIYLALPCGAGDREKKRLYRYSCPTPAIVGKRVRLDFVL